LGTERKTPLSEAGAATPGRHQKTQARSKVARTRLLVGGLAALAVIGGGLYLARSGGDDGGIIGDLLGDGDARPVPEVTLTFSDVEYDATSPDAPADAQKATTTLETMLRTAYVDPATWDDAGAVAEAFSGDASDQVGDDVAVLTLGEDAGDTYDYVDPGEATLAVQVLTGAKGEALRAYASVVFPGLAEHDDGTYTKLVIDGSYFLVHEDGTWKIVSYRVDRQEKPAKAPKSPSASASATTSQEGSG
jgi:hypothetical protein